MAENDAVIFINFRTDRTRQLTQAMIEPDFDEFERVKKSFHFVAMTQYYDTMPAAVAFPEILLSNLL
jgi:2,3-bisphosphoglycerate-independent phosphoglycerate mutase